MVYFIFFSRSFGPIVMITLFQKKKNINPSIGNYRLACSLSGYRGMLHHVDIG